jgi:hypothetical protein
MIFFSVTHNKKQRGRFFSAFNGSKNAIPNCGPNLVLLSRSQVSLGNACPQALLDVNGCKREHFVDDTKRSLAISIPKPEFGNEIWGGYLTRDL